MCSNKALKYIHFNLRLESWELSKNHSENGINMHLMQCAEKYMSITFDVYLLSFFLENQKSDYFFSIKCTILSFFMKSGVGSGEHNHQHSSPRLAGYLPCKG